jgi:hypothetical protein
VLLLWIRLVQAGQDQQNGTVALCVAQGAEVFQDVFLGVVHRLDRHKDDVGQVVETSKVFLRLVVGFVEAARVEEGDERCLGRGKLILS